MRETNMTIHNSFTVNLPVRMSMIVSTIRRHSIMSHPIPYLVGRACFIELLPFRRDINDIAHLVHGTQQNIHLLEKVLVQRNKPLPCLLH